MYFKLKITSLFVLISNCVLTQGCIDMEACNFNPEATEDDGSCCYENCGCTESEALNFSNTADCDDGSCQYASINCETMSADIDQEYVVCSGNSIELFPETEYVENLYWFVEGENLGNDEVFVYNPSIDTSFIQLVFENDFCIDSVTIMVNTFDLTNPEMTFDNLHICQGESTTLSSSGEYQSVWSYNGDIYSLEESITVNETGLYSVVQVNGSCVSNSISASVEVHQQPEAIINASDSVFCEGSSVFLESEGYGSIEWITGAEIYSTNQTTQTSNPGVYMLVTSESYCESDTSYIVLTELPAPINPLLFLVGETLVSDTQTDMIYNWYLNGELISSGEESTLDITESGIYNVELENEVGCTSSSDNVIFTGIEEAALTDVFAYPNPMTDQLTVEFGRNTISNLEVYSQAGQKVRFYSNLEMYNLIKIPREDLSSGNYYLHVTGKNGEIKVLRFTVQ